jgi:hypothetical protein
MVTNLYLEGINKNSERFFISNTSEMMKSHDSLRHTIVATKGTDDSKDL